MRIEFRDGLMPGVKLAGIKTMVESERTAQIKDMIRQHLEAIGPKNWNSVRARCPEISDATFWRYAKSIREELGMGLGPAGAPVPPVPSANAERVLQAAAGPGFFDFYNVAQKVRQYEGLLAQAETMAAHARDHRGRIVNWRMYAKAIALQDKLLWEQLQFMEVLQRTEAAEQFYKTVVRVVAATAPEVARKIMKDLYALKEQGASAGSQSPAPQP